MKIDKFVYENQKMSEYLMRNEARMTTDQFFEKLLQDESLDPKNCTVRETWVHDNETEWCGQYMVVFGRHFHIRAWQRFCALSSEEVIEKVMHQLGNNQLALAITEHPVYWDDGEISTGDDGIKATAVIEEGVPFVCIYECGDSYICPVTLLKKTPNLYFHEDTRVLYVSRTGKVSCK